ncbi:MAG: HNH endonuclease [Candidatus Omnitrophota bacterium]
MPTYLLTWNPKRFNWDNLQDILNQGFYSGRWSCGNTKKIVKGDRVFLIKLGKEPRGIMASGWATRDVYNDKHWNLDAEASYIDVHFDNLLDPAKSIFSFNKLNKEIYDKMNWHPQASGLTIPDDVAKQLEIDWAEFTGRFSNVSDFVLAEELDASKTFPEGATKQIIVNAYERNPQARSRCIAKYGYNCSVCGFNFQEIYGELGTNYIHVHHLEPLSQIGNDKEVNPEKDLRPVCPNCHAMLHRDKTRTIEELKTIIEGKRKIFIKSRNEP